MMIALAVIGLGALAAMIGAAVVIIEALGQPEDDDLYNDDF